MLPLFVFDRARLGWIQKGQAHTELRPAGGCRALSKQHERDRLVADDGASSVGRPDLPVGSTPRSCARERWSVTPGRGP